MTNRTQIKICGIKTPEALETAIDAEASFIGFVFHAASSRAVSLDEAALLSRLAGARVKKVGLCVDPDDDRLNDITKRVDLDMLQLHGHEDAQRVHAIRIRTALPIIKAIPVATKSDLEIIPSFESVADWLLFDAKVAGQSGGLGVAFDWTLLKGFKSSRPWMLSGGLNAGNVKEALSVLQPHAVDVSSGVEDGPGVKSPDKIRAFIKAVRSV